MNVCVRDPANEGEIMPGPARYSIFNSFASQAVLLRLSGLSGGRTSIFNDQPNRTIAACQRVGHGIRQAFGARYHRFSAWHRYRGRDGRTRTTKEAVTAKAVADNAAVRQKGEAEQVASEARTQLEIARNAAERQKAEADKAEAEATKADADAGTLDQHAETPNSKPVPMLLASKARPKSAATERKRRLAKLAPPRSSSGPTPMPPRRIT